MKANTKKDRGNGVLQVVGPLNNRVVLPRMLSLNQTGWYIGIAPKTIRNQLSNKSFPVKPKKLGSKVLFGIKDLDRFLDELKGV